jgi:hypothetical protein
MVKCFGMEYSKKQESLKIKEQNKEQTKRRISRKYIFKKFNEYMNDENENNDYSYMVKDYFNNSTGYSEQEKASIQRIIETIKEDFRYENKKIERQKKV